MGQKEGKSFLLAKKILVNELVCLAFFHLLKFISLTCIFLKTQQKHFNSEGINLQCYKDVHRFDFYEWKGYCLEWELQHSSWCNLAAEHPLLEWTDCLDVECISCCSGTWELLSTCNNSYDELHPVSYIYIFKSQLPVTFLPLQTFSKQQSFEFSFFDIL